MMPAVTVGETTIPYRVRRSRRAKRLRLVVKPGLVEVVAPRRAGAPSIAVFVDSKRHWLYDKTRAVRELGLAALPERFVSGAKVLYRGRFLRLRVEMAEVPRAELRYATAFLLRVPSRLDASARERAARDCVVTWLRQRALDDARALIDRHAPALGVRPSGLRIGRQKTLWGSCSARGVISLNWRLMAAPRAIYEYVVVHELCHLRERNHGPRFWRLVAAALPDYRERRNWLKRHGVALG